jgi:excisionase family DNA binding protein
MFYPKANAWKEREPLGSIAEVAIYLNVAEVTVRRKINSGELPISRFGKQIRIGWADVEALIRRRSVPPTA